MLYHITGSQNILKYENCVLKIIILIVELIPNKLCSILLLIGFSK